MYKELIIPPRWMSITQLQQYAPALGKKKIVRHIKNGDFDAYLDGGEWVIDRLSVDNFFSQNKHKKEAFVEETLARLAGVM